MKTNFINQLQREPLTAVAIGAGASLLGSGMNAWAQGRMNKKTRRFARQMYDKQRADALADYHMQNEYNSPEAQMARFKAAKLNPNLIYGQSNEGGVVRSTDYDSPPQKAPEFDLSAVSHGIGQYYDLKMRAAQTDNLKKALEATEEQIKLTQAQTASTLAGVKRTELGAMKDEFDLALANALRPLTVESAELHNRKAAADLAYTLHQDERAAAMNAQNLKKGIEEILNLRAQRARTDEERKNIEQQRKILNQEEILKQYEIDLNQSGSQKSDSWIFRKTQEILNTLQEKAQEYMRKRLPTLK